MPDAGDGAMILATVAVLGYVLGSIPFGVVITKLMGLGDLRQIGSGNIGATNVLRTGNKVAAALTLVLDGAKGAAAVGVAWALLGNETAMMIAGASAFIGHLYPVWLKFRGGKGVATFLGTVLALAWPLGLIACAIWLLTAIVSRISSLSALVSAALAVPLAQVLGYRELMPTLAIMAVLIFWRHRANIQRLAQGREPRIGQKS